MIAAGHAIQALLNSSRSLYDELIGPTLTDVEWEPSGLLFVLRSQRGMDHYAETDHLLRSEFGTRRRRATTARLYWNSSRRCYRAVRALGFTNRRPSAARQADARLATGA